MTAYPIYQIDAFTDKLFAGNPAAVMPLEQFFDDQTLQSIALENNLSETAFVVRRNDGSYDLRWFTPTNEVDFCGHATLAAAHVLIVELDVKPPLIFHTKIGPIEVTQSANGYTMRTPGYAMVDTPLTPILRETFAGLPKAAWLSRKNIFLMFPNADSVARFEPDFSAIKALSSEKGFDDGFIIMAPGDGEVYGKYDFVSRYFVPAFGIDEDPVTGSNHASLAPFWAQRLDKTKLTAFQCSARGGVLELSVQNGQVLISGKAITYLRGEIFLP